MDTPSPAAPTGGAFLDFVMMTILDQEFRAHREKLAPPSNRLLPA